MLSTMRTFLSKSILPRRLDSGKNSIMLTSGLPEQEEIPNPFKLKPLKTFDLYEATIAQIQTCLTEGKFSSVDYVKFCLERIRQVNQYLEAVIETNPDALQIASVLDEERQKGSVRGQLHGIPVLVKDNMATDDLQQTTAGSWALLGSRVPRDAHVVALLRKAGAVILGHANMSEWASVRSRQYSTGFSPRGGQTRNPFDLSQSPFGSSSGSAVAVSANIVPLAFGTETDTSIIGPASINGVVGIKPTVGLTSRAGVIPISENMDTVGSFGKTVADAVAGLNAIVGKDDRDSFTKQPGRKQEDDYDKFLSGKLSLSGAKLGIPVKRCWELAPEEQKEAASRIFDNMRKVGAEVVFTDFPCAEDRIPVDGNWDWEHGIPSQSEWTVARIDAYNGINAYLKDLSESALKSLEDVVKFNDNNDGSEGASEGKLPAFASGQDLLREVVASKGAKNELYQDALQYIQKACRENGIDGALTHLDKHENEVKLDALLMCDFKGAGQQIAAQAGYPIVCIPIGLDTNGLPFSLSILGTAWSEGKLIQLASAIEDLHRNDGTRRPTPTFKNCHAKNIPIGS